jgi:hypothetical protein
LLTYIRKVAKVWGGRISGWVLAVIGLGSLFSTALVTRFSADPALPNDVLYGTAFVSFLCCAWLWIRAHYDVWIATDTELQTLRKKHERPELELRFDEAEQRFIVVNNGGDAYKVCVIFMSLGCHINLTEKVIPKLSASSKYPVSFVIATPSIEGSKTTHYELASRDRNELLQMCEVIFDRVPHETSTENFFIRYEDVDAVEYETECQIAYDQETRRATVSFVRSQRYKPFVTPRLRFDGSSYGHLE